MTQLKAHKATQCVHAGTLFDPATRGVLTPIYSSSSFEYEGCDDMNYPRYFNTPNQRVVVNKVCALEGAEDGVLFSSGMATISTSILAFVEPGDHMVMQAEVYGGTWSFATDHLQRRGIDCSLVATDADAIIAAVTDKTRIIYIETPTNPLLSVVDIRKVAEFARARGIVTLIDNTFASPINQNPIELGIDVVIHSGTKYLGGHSDLCFGIAVTTKELNSRIFKLARQLGGSVNAQTCSLIERSLKTLMLRVERQCANAKQIARFLQNHSAIEHVYYPGLEDFAGHTIAKAQMKDFGAMLSFELKTDDVSGFLNRLKIIHPACSLGGVESLICSPATTSHASLSAEERQRLGVSDALLRLSVGIEQVDDLIGDIEQAIKI